MFDNIGIFLLYVIIINAEKQLVHSKKVQEIDPVKKVAPLLVLSPHHGSVCYLWEKRGVTRWELVYTPSDTCILYAKSRGLYKCSVEGQVVEFEVIGMIIIMYILCTEHALIKKIPQTQDRVLQAMVSRLYMPWNLTMS